jgi:hypothetical protein
MLLVTHATSKSSAYELIPLVLIGLLFVFVMRHKRR